jgi:hypothetical protein
MRPLALTGDEPVGNAAHEEAEVSVRDTSLLEFEPIRAQTPNCCFREPSWVLEDRPLFRQR